MERRTHTVMRDDRRRVPTPMANPFRRGREQYGRRVQRFIRRCPRPSQQTLMPMLDDRRPMLGVRRLIAMRHRLHRVQPPTEMRRTMMTRGLCPRGLKARRLLARSGTNQNVVPALWPGDGSWTRPRRWETSNSCAQCSLTSIGKEQAARFVDGR